MSESRRDVLAAFSGLKKAADGWTARCPSHDDHRNSLSIGRGDNGRWLLKCHAGCAISDVLTAAGLELTDLLPGSEERPRHETAYDYHDERGELLYQVVRLQPKNFRQRRPDGAGGWIWNLKDTRRVLYRLPKLQGHKTMFVCEGEKDCDRLVALGLPATTNAAGAGKWRSEYVEQLKAAGCQRIVVLPDNDPPGETHARDVARGCVDAGLAVKVVALPGLPPKGDVSDFLGSHSKDELLAIVGDAPPFDPRRLVTAGAPLELTSLADLLSEPDDQVEYIVHDRIPAGGVVLWVAPPKAGKSTAAREMAFAVSRGEPWLGWRTTFGGVWLIALEDKRSEIRKHFRVLGATGCEPIRMFVGQAPVDLLPTLHQLAQEERPALIIVDTLARAIKAKDFNNYAEITERFEPLLKLSRATGAALLLLHHASAHSAREGLDAVLGSTALAGSVDNILILKRHEQQRVLSSVQRIGPDLEPTIVVLSDTGRLERAGSKRDVDDRELGARILGVLREQSEPVTETWLQGQVEGRHADQVRVLRRLLGMGDVRRVGAGGRKDPFRYQVADSGSRNLHRESPSVGIAGTSISPGNSGLNFESAIEVPEVPYIYPEPEVLKPLRIGNSPTHVPILVPQVPEVPAVAGFQSISDLENAKHPRKTERDSGSRESVYERL